MGAWGIGAFENDDAADWLYELEGSTGDGVLAAAFEAVLGDEGAYLEVTDGANAIAAAAVTAALLGRPGDDLSDGATAWIDANRGPVRPELVALADRALERVARSSELQELWDESGDAAAWHASVDDLRRRLAGA